MAAWPHPCWRPLRSPSIKCLVPGAPLRSTALRFARRAMCSFARGQRTGIAPIIGEGEAVRALSSPLTLLPTFSTMTIVIYGLFEVIAADADAHSNMDMHIVHLSRPSRSSISHPRPGNTS